MAASYPSATKSFSTKTNGSAIAASHVNDLQDEVVAIEADLRAGLPVARGGLGALTETAHGVLLGQGTSPVTATAVGATGTVLAGNTAADPTYQSVPTVLGTQAANAHFAGPISGSAATPAFRALDPLDLASTVVNVTSQFDKAANTTLADITGLTFTLVAGKTYNFRAVLFLALDATGGAKVAVAGTATATTFRAGILYGPSGAGTPVGGIGTTLGASLSAQVGPTASVAYVDGYFVVNAGGTLTIQFAQNSANGTSSVQVGSSLTVW